ncbi:hypothetical protein P5E93_14905 [Clostridium perfringens]|nr:hypothetical protein [Clostridium perfringens]
MKHGVKLTRKHKEFLSKQQLDPRDYLLERQDDKSFTFIHRETKEKLILNFR